MQEQDLDAKILILSKYFPKVKNEEIKEGAEAIDNQYLALQITSAYETVSMTRFIVDGLKRSLGILNKIGNDHKFRPVTILEYYGP
ncbi:MAG: hypothetical protein ACRD5B_06305 [Nitrososphaeraceae archaeon]|jgi:hypothetical protein